MAQGKHNVRIGEAALQIANRLAAICSAMLSSRLECVGFGVTKPDVAKANTFIFETKVPIDDAHIQALAETLGATVVIKYSPEAEKLKAEQDKEFKPKGEDDVRVIDDKPRPGLSAVPAPEIQAGQ